MASADEEKFMRSLLLLLKGTLFIAKKVVTREEQKEIQRTGRDLDDVLKDNRKKIEHKFKKYKQREILFPPSGRTKVEMWDISLLTGVLLNVFESSLSDDERKAVKNIRTQGKEVYAHTDTASLSDNDYIDICDGLKTSFYTLASGFSSEIHDQCKNIVDTCLSGALDHVEELKRLTEMDSIFRETIRNIDRAGEETTTNVSKALKQETSDVVQAISQSEKTINRSVIENDDFEKEAAMHTEKKEERSNEKGVTDFEEEAAMQTEKKEERSNEKGATDFEKEAAMHTEKKEERSNEKGATDFEEEAAMQTEKKEERSNEKGATGQTDFEKEAAMHTEKKEERSNEKGATDFEEEAAMQTEKKEERSNEKGATGQTDFEEETAMQTEKKEERSNEKGATDMSKKGEEEIKVDRVSDSDSYIYSNRLYVTKTCHWEDCLRITDEARQIERANKLLDSKILPDQEQVRLSLSAFGRRSETFRRICSLISEYLRSKFDDVIDVWAAYRYNNNMRDEEIKPVFAVITKKGKAGINENDFDIIERDETDFSIESEKVLMEVENDLSNEIKFPESKLTNIETCVSMYAPDLMDKHRNLNIVSPCLKKSKQFGKRDAQIADELCIVLHVHIKGLIPIEEDPFPPKIEDFPTDVLEGGFKLFHGGPYDYYEQLKMGLAIHANVTDNNGDRLFGTLGGFLDYPSVGMCALTCAHVVLTTDEMQQLIPCNQMNFIERDKKVFQSADTEAQAFGQVILAFYRRGEYGVERKSSGIDVALIQIKQRHPKDGSFPSASNYADAGFDESNPMVYSKGKVSALHGIRRRAEVYKYGISTGVTRGSVGLHGTLVKTSEMSVNSKPYEYRLHNQIEVLRIGDKCFALPGDSGALVFFDDADDDSVAIGIVEGGHTNNRIVYVTPICEILNCIGDRVSMTKFVNNGSVSNGSGIAMDTS